MYQHTDEDFRLGTGCHGQGDVCRFVWSKHTSTCINPRGSEEKNTHILINISHVEINHSECFDHLVMIDCGLCVMKWVRLIHQCITT